MNNNEDRYFIIKKLYLAQSLSWLGFRYFKVNDKVTGELGYSFIDNEKFQFALNGLLELKLKIGY